MIEIFEIKIKESKSEIYIFKKLLNCEYNIHISYIS